MEDSTTSNDSLGRDSGSLPLIDEFERNSSLNNFKDLKLNDEVLKNIGKRFSKISLSCREPLNIVKPQDFDYPFPYLRRGEDKFENISLVLLNYFKLYHLKRWDWSVKSCPINQQLNIYRMVNNLTSNRDQNELSCSLGSSGFHNSSGLSTKDSLKTQEYLDIIKDENKGIEVRKLRNEAQEKFEVLIKNTKRKIVTGSSHQLNIKNMKDEVYEEIQKSMMDILNTKDKKYAFSEFQQLKVLLKLFKYHTKDEEEGQSGVYL